MAQRNTAMKQKHTPRHREQTCGCQGRGREGRTASLGLADATYCVWDGKTRSRYTAQGTKHPMTDQNEKECIYTYIYLSHFFLQKLTL